MAGRHLMASRPGRFALGSVGVLLVLAFWELMIRAGMLSEQDFTPPSQIVPTLIDIAGTGWFWTAVWASVRTAGIGLGIACVIAIPLGIAVGSVRLLGLATRPTIEFLRTVPGIALIPFAILQFGANSNVDVFLIVFGCTWPLLAQVTQGVRAVDDVALQAARSYGLSAFDRVRHVVFHATMPYLATGFRIFASVALIIAVTAEIIVGTPGLGNEISARQGAGRVDEMYALIFVTGVLGLMIQVVFGRFERRFLHWHQSQRAQVGRS
ncbi:MAG: ABC transporter permease [Solirubrobacteraceae bacterium]